MQGCILPESGNIPDWSRRSSGKIFRCRQTVPSSHFSDKLALYVTLTHPELAFADNALILLPKEKISVRIIGHELLQSRVE